MVSEMTVMDPCLQLPIGHHELSENDWQRLKVCETKQESLRLLSRRTRRFSDEERLALDVESHHAFKVFWEQALTSKIRFDKTREQGIGRVSSNVTSVAASAFDIVQHLSPLLEAVKDIGAPYGRLALGTICFVLTVAKNRAEKEDRIVSTLIHIQDRLPALQMYQHIHSGNTNLELQLQSKVVEAYESFILFCIEASHFYSQNRIVRWLNVLSGLGNIHFEAARVQKATVDIRRVCEELVDQNIHQIKKLNIDLSKGIEELQEGRVSDKLQSFRTLLQVEPYSLEEQLSQLTHHQQDVAVEFGYPYTDRPPYQQVERSSTFQTWLHCPTSQVLVLSGLNDVITAPHCWLSPVALDLIAEKTSYSEPCIFFLPPSTATPNSDVTNNFPSILHFLIYRLLSCLPRSALRSHGNQIQTLEAELSRYSSSSFSHLLPLHELETILSALLIRVLRLFANSDDKSPITVWIILERIDQCCRGGTSTHPNPSHPAYSSTVGRLDDRIPTAAQSRNHRRALLRTLVRAAEEQNYVGGGGGSVVLKVLAVANTRDWDVGREKEDIGQERLLLQDVGHDRKLAEGRGEASFVVGDFAEEDYS